MKVPDAPIRFPLFSNGGFMLSAWVSWFTLATKNANKLESVPEHADNAAALAAGLGAGDVYRSGDLLKVVH